MSGQGRGSNKGRCRGRGRGRGQGRGQRNNNLGSGRGRGINNILKSMPKSLLSFQDGWEEVASDESYQIFLDDEYRGINNGDVMVKTYLNMAKKVVASLGRSGLKVTTTNIFNHLLSEAVILKIVEYTTECLVKFGHDPTYIGEYKRFLATRWLRSRFRLGLEQAYVIMYDIAKRKGFFT